MKSAPNHYEALNLLRQRLDSADPVIEQCLKAHKDKSEVYDDLKHNAFQEINSVLIALKGLADTIEPELNTRPIYRLLEEFRNNFDIVALNMWGDREIVSVGGKEYSEKSFAEALSINESAVGKHITAIKNKGFLVRQGDTRGYWEINLDKN